MDKKELLLKLGNKIRYERMRKGLSQEELAEFANVNMRSISTIECGVTDIKFSTLYKISQTLDISLTSITDFRL